MKHALTHARKLQGGLTLIELLVTMVLIGFVVALMSGAFVQIAQMLRISGEHGNGFAGRWTQSRVMQDMVANMLPDSAFDVPLTGKTAEVTFTTLAAPPLAAGVAQRATLVLKTNGFVPSTETITAVQLSLANTASGEPNQVPFEIATFEGRLFFVYLDASGLEHRQWPPPGSLQTDKLPSAIGLRNELQQGNLVQLARYEGVLSSKRSGGIEGMFGVVK